MTNDRLQKMANQTNKQIAIKTVLTAVIFVVIFVLLDLIIFELEDNPIYYFWMAVIFSAIFGISDINKRSLARKQLGGKN